MLESPEPQNKEGKLTSGGVTVTYYYTKLFKITTAVIEHYEVEKRSILNVIYKDGNEANETGKEASNEPNLEGIDNTDKNKNGTNNSGELVISNTTEGKILVKGGTISGEGETAYETINRNNSNTKEIKIVPNPGYRVKYVRIKGANSEQDTTTNAGQENKSNAGTASQPDPDTIDITKLLNPDGTITLPAGYFQNIQSDKHIEVEFERIPSKVLVAYKEKSTEEEILTTQEMSGYVGDTYITHETEIPYYELIKAELPESTEGVLGTEDTLVTYWYRKLPFNMKITKQFTSVLVNGNNILGKDKKLIKIDIPNSKLQEATIQVKYKITVTNTEEVAGTAHIEEQIPVGFKFVNKGINAWEEKSGKYYLTTKELQPGESIEYEVILEWDTNRKCMGTLEAIARITETQNVPEFSETTLEDNRDSCTMLISIKTGEDRTIKKIISIACFTLAGICAVAYIATEVSYRRKNQGSGKE